MLLFAWHIYTHISNRLIFVFVFNIFFFFFFKWLIYVTSVTLVDIHSHVWSLTMYCNKWQQVFFETNHLWPEIRCVPVCSSQNIKIKTFSLSCHMCPHFEWTICQAEMTATWTPVQLNTLIYSVGAEGPRCDFLAPHQRNPTECCQRVISLAVAHLERKNCKEGRNHVVVDRAQELCENCGGRPIYTQSETHLCCFPGQVKTVIVMISEAACISEYIMSLCCCPGQVKTFSVTNSDSLHTSAYYIIYLRCSSGEVRTFTATDSDCAYTDNLDKLCPASSRLHLKVGAQVCITLDIISIPLQGRARVFVCIIGRSCYKYNFCRNKTFVTTKHVFCCNKSMLAVTKLLSQQNHVCHDKRACCDKTFVVTKIILVAAPASDTLVSRGSLLEGTALDLVGLN